MDHQFAGSPSVVLVIRATMGLKKIKLSERNERMNASIMEIRLFNGCLFCFIAFTPDCIDSVYFLGDGGVFVLLHPQRDMDCFTHGRLTAGETAFIEYPASFM